MSNSSHITQILKAIESGEPNSAEKLFPLVYQELRALAVAKLRNERVGHTLQPTALVHEVFIRLISPQDHQNWDNLGHFFSAAANAMRRILIENARKKYSLKRGGDRDRVDVSMDELEIAIDDDRLIKLDEALDELAKQDPVKAKLVELRFFGGLDIQQTCQVLKISRATANRYWSFAKAWLFLKISEQSSQ
jgi:RNA polymerase sigma factor (TIGR02999 family)